MYDLCLLLIQVQQFVKLMYDYILIRDLDFIEGDTYVAKVVVPIASYNKEAYKQLVEYEFEEFEYRVIINERGVRFDSEL